ncbi:DUF4166 domain-containing protein [Maricaulis sp.]|uniref:DUF4166 domain-containing protein n=1 Tax=Maricaulis sp. TaxID=1486257 RepID=UPI002621CA86|nr:DUF4166 domain-containing protein [Maricaulis sp.]
MKLAVIPQTVPAAAEPFDIRLARKTGRQWASLPASVRRRFLKYVGARDCVVYRGHVVETRRNAIGAVLTQILRLIGAPLPLQAKTDDGPAVVTITRDAASGGQIWTRQYAGPRGLPQIIHSVKAFAGPTGLEERIGAGFAMALTLEVAGDALMFKSAGYRWRGFGLDLALPHWLAPGDLTVGHHPAGDTAFHFTLDLIHPWFGELLHQRLYFEDMKEA